MRSDYAQAGGGNTSEKINATEMLVKSSGYSLSELSENKGISKVIYKKISDFLFSDELASSDETKVNKLLEDNLISGNRPSIETFLHSVTKFKYTAHSHPLTANILLSRKEGETELKKLFPYCLFVDYATPGLELTKIYVNALKESPTLGVDSKSKAQVIFLRNHGLVVSADNEDTVIDVTDEINSKIADYLGIDIEPYQTQSRLLKLLSDDNLISDGNIIYLAENTNIEKALEVFPNGWNYKFCPDCVVYCGSEILKLDGLEDEVLLKKQAKDFVMQNGQPIVILLNHHIYIVAANVAKAQDIESVLSFSAQVVMSNFSSDKQISYLDKNEVAKLLNWDAEKYRKNLNS